MGEKPNFSEKVSALTAEAKFNLHHGGTEFTEERRMETRFLRKETSPW
jgi:hypothetical protein